MTKLEIIGFAASTYVRSTRLACAEKGIDYELTPNGMTSPADISGPEHRKLHPFGRIPVMRHGDTIVFESPAICHYIDANFDGPDLMPTDRNDWIIQEQWSHAINYYIDRYLVRECIVQYAFPSGPDGQPDMARINAAVPEMEKGIQGLKSAFDNGPFIGGDNPAIPDFLLLPMIDYFVNVPEGKELLKDATYLLEFRAAFGERPSYTETLPDSLKQAAE